MWLENESIPTTPKSKLLYYQFDVPEDTVSVKLMVNQLQGDEPRTPGPHDRELTHLLRSFACSGVSCCLLLLLLLLP